MYQYGTPSQALAERPRCWSKAFDEGARECRGCSFQTSCKEEIIRLNSLKPVAAPAPQQYFQQFQPQFQPYAVPQPVQVIQPAQPAQAPAVPQFRGLQVAPVPPQQQRPVHQVPHQPYGYGWIQDPLYYTLSSAPPPMRHQMGEETFFDRTVKNVGLAMLESFFGQCLLAVRQMVLPPVPRIIDVQPQQTPGHPHQQ